MKTASAPSASRLSRDERAELCICCYVSFIWHACWIAFSLGKNSYDGPTHIFFAHHYAANWFSLWEQAWYGGFHITSYPPLVHQLVALVSFMTGLEPAFFLVLLGALTLFPLGIYCFSRIFISHPEAVRAAFLSIFLPALNLHAHIFGQLPFLVSSLALLFLFAELKRYLSCGGAPVLVRCALLAAVVSASHGFSGATIGIPGALLIMLGSLLKGRGRATLSQVLLPGSLCLLAAWLVIYPHFEWRSLHLVLQRPIPHFSRADMLIDELGRRAFFWCEYGPLVLFVPLLPLLVWSDIALLPLAAFCLFNFVLGLGGSTGVPELFFGEAWEWLTYDRFSFWASLLLLPCVARLFRLKPGGGGNNTGKIRLQSIFAVLILAFTGYQIADYTRLGSPFRFPEPINMHSLVLFLGSDQNDAWRYLTLGFGEQAVRLSYLTHAKTPDGMYHTARRIPELVNSGIGMIDWAPRVQRPDVLETFLKSPGRFNLRWVFSVADPRCKILLKKTGWLYRQTFGNGIELWEAPAKVPAIAPPDSEPLTRQALAWGIAPMACLLTLLVLYVPKVASRPAKNGTRGSPFA